MLIVCAHRMNHRLNRTHTRAPRLVLAALALLPIYNGPIAAQTVAVRNPDTLFLGGYSRAEGINNREVVGVALSTEGFQSYYWSVTGRMTSAARIQVSVEADLLTSDSNIVDIRISEACIDILQSAAFSAPVPSATATTPTAVRDATAAKSQVPAAVSDPAAELKNAELKKQEEAVRRVLLDYKRAYENLDAQAAKAIWPSLDARVLERAFRQLDGLQMRFAICGVSVSGQGANARCQGDTTYHPKDGSGVVHLKTVKWTFDLARDNDRWHIVIATFR